MVLGDEISDPGDHNCGLRAEKKAGPCIWQEVHALDRLRLHIFIHQRDSVIWSNELTLEL
jgi:hypothetical protein